MEGKAIFKNSKYVSIILGFFLLNNLLEKALKALFIAVLSSDLKHIFSMKKTVILITVSHFTT